MNIYDFVKLCFEFLSSQEFLYFNNNKLVHSVLEHINDATKQLHQ